MFLSVGGLAARSFDLVIDEFTIPFVIQGDLFVNFFGILEDFSGNALLLLYIYIYIYIYMHISIYNEMTKSIKNIMHFIFNNRHILFNNDDKTIVHDYLQYSSDFINGIHHKI